MMVEFQERGVPQLAASWASVLVLDPERRGGGRPGENCRCGAHLEVGWGDKLAKRVVV